MECRINNKGTLNLNFSGEEPIYETSKQCFAGEWVPVTEHLPKDAGLKLVTLLSANNDRSTGLARFTGETWVEERGRGAFPLTEEVAAWSELPDPYDGVGK